MTKKNTFSSENQPDNKARRGKSFKNKLLDVIREESLLDVKKGASNEVAEKAYITHLAKRAFDSEDPQSHILLKETLAKSYPSLKSALPAINFDLPDDASPMQKADAVFNAIATGSIPPDVGAMLISAAKSTIDIEIGTELKDRIEKLEAMASEQSS